MNTTRLWLIEFVTSLRQRTDRAMLFPFWKGWAEDHGVETRWLCVGGRHEVAGDGRGHYDAVAVLDAQDERALAGEIERGRPTHLLLNENPGESLDRAIRDAAPDALVASLSRIAGTCRPFVDVMEECLRGDRVPSGWKRDRSFAAIDLLYRDGWFARWLGVPARTRGGDGRGRLVADRAAPRYDAEMFNEAAVRLEPMIRIVGGVFCDYRRPVRANEVYREVDLSGCSRETGCAFCPVRSPAITGRDRDPVGIAIRQFEALARGGKRVPRDLGHYDLHDIRLFRRVDEFAKRVCSLKMHASTFCFSPRIDHVLKARRRLETALELFAEAGHTLRLFRIGAESFSEIQQARFNKGISRSQIEAVLALTRDLERRWPKTFQCTQPLAFITFTPWTTLEEVRATLAEARRWGLPPRGRWLYSTLELDRDAPITALAMRDGDILCDDWDDAALRYATSVVGTFREGQAAWRFRDPRVAVFHAILVRLCAAVERDFPDRVFHGDALYGRIRDWVRSEGAGTVEPLDFAEQLLEVMASAPPPWDRDALARETLVRLVRAGRAGPPVRERLLWLLREVTNRWPGAVPDTRVEDVVMEGTASAVFRLNIRGERCVLRVAPAGSRATADVESRRFLGVVEEPGSFERAQVLARMSRLLRLLDVLVPRHAPRFLGAGGECPGRTPEVDLSGRMC